MLTSFLEFGAINLESPSRQIWEFRTGDQAYEWLMLVRYANDLLGYSQLATAAAGITVEEALDKELPID